MGKGKANDAAMYRVLIAVAVAGAIAALSVLILAPHLWRNAPTTGKPAVHAVAPPKQVTGKMLEIRTAPVTSPATPKDATASAASESRRAIRQKKAIAPQSTSATQALSQPAVPSNPPPLKSLGMPMPAARGAGLDVATLKAACQRDAAADLSDRLGIKNGDGSGRPLLRTSGTDGDHVRASIGGCSGRPLSEKSFAVNVESTFR